MMDYEVNFDGRSSGRNAYRTTLSGLVARLADNGASHSVLNLSATGMALDCSGRGFARGETLVCDLVLAEVRIFRAIRARVVRVIGREMVGCDFVGLSREDETKLDKLILEVQKRLISARKRLDDAGPEEDVDGPSDIAT